eukprot:TRINITY_DN1265_c0_g1_i1.p1 TRINITY_DN1265_c0_g1~~TRINITY_DN1265_c0_g1_i1.p1  ORF type:complete len:530 (-),score=124.52 TRINITY_DN1265_c0_g1_i1:37-1626(-)
MLAAALIAVIVAHSVTAVPFQFGVTYSAAKDETGVWSISEGITEDAIAYGVFNFTQNTVGWNSLDIITVASFPDRDQAFGAGFLEAALTQPLMYQEWLDFKNASLNFSEEDMHALALFTLTQINWVTTQVKGNPTDPYWQQVGLVIEQFDGINEAYNQYSPTDEQLNYLDFVLSQLNSEIGDIMHAIRQQNISVDPEEMMYRSHCSSLVKVTPDGDLYSSHVTWTAYSGMLRIWKNYNFQFQSSHAKSKIVSFSGYPGYIPSGDDWFVTDQQMTIAETTNSVMNNSLFQFVTPQTVPYWIRVSVANRMASGGEEWTEVFAKENSGTYNNQWIIVDYKLFTKGKPLKPNTLWIAEQIPGYVISADKTDVLEENSYWASYNIPYFPFVYNISGYPAAYKAKGDAYSYTGCPRARIFTRDQHTVSDMDSMKKIMRYNKWQVDPLSLGNACNSISARCDLNPENPSPFGAIDGKIANSETVKSIQSQAVAGPTWDSQPPFAWTGEWTDVAHYGEVQVYDFDWIAVQPKSPNQF